MTTETLRLRVLPGIPGPAGAAGADGADAVLSNVTDTNPLPVYDANIVDYETVAAGQTDQVMGNSGAIGDYLYGITIIPASTSPGAVSIKDGGGSAITVFAGGSGSVGSLHPFFVLVGANSTLGAWKVTTGASVSVLATGNFT